MDEMTTSEEKPSETTTGFDEIKAETAKLFNMVGSTVSMTIQEVTNRLLLHLDHETRRHLDLLVEYGAAQDRHEAVVFLITEGIKANRLLFERMEHANVRIASLQTQLHALNFKEETL